MPRVREARAGSFAHGRTLFCFLLAVAFAACGGGGGGGGGSTPTGPTPPANQLFTLSGIVTEGPATSGFEGYFRDDTGGNKVGGFGRGSQSVVGEQSSVLGEQSREREHPDEILIDDNPDIADPLHAAAVGDTLAGVVVQIIDGSHMGKSATTGSDGSYQIVGVSGGMTLTATKSGYKTQTKSVTVSANTTLNFGLAIDIVTYTLSGYVREDGVASSSTAGEPISGVVLRVTDGPYIDKSSTTGSDGRYEIVGVVGGMTLSATKTGYVTFFKSVTVTSGATLDFDIGIETRKISGQITDIITGAAVGNLTITIEGVGTTTTNGDGQYGFDTDATGTLPMTISGAGYIRRDTWIDANAPLTVNGMVIPDGNGFTLAYHDEVFRENGTEGTRQWMTPPTYEIWDRKLSCVEYVELPVSGDESDITFVCGKATVLDEPTSSSFQPTAITEITSVVTRLAGIWLQNSQITTRNVSSSIGETIEIRPDEDLSAAGTVAVFEVVMPEHVEDSTSWAQNSVYYGANNWYALGYMALNTRHVNHSNEAFAAGTMRHEAAHTIGWAHPNGYDFSQYGGSVMGCCSTIYPITPADELHGRIMYTRWGGSKTPDVDPANFRLNSWGMYSGRKVGDGSGRIIMLPIIVQ